MKPRFLIKRKYGDKLRSRKWFTQFKETKLKVIVYNIERSILVFIRGFLQNYDTINLMLYDSKYESYLPVISRVMERNKRGVVMDFVGNTKYHINEYPNLKKLDIITNLPNNSAGITESLDNNAKVGFVITCQDGIDCFPSYKKYKKFFEDYINKFREHQAGVIMFLDEKEADNPTFRKLYSIVDYILKYPKYGWKCEVIRTL